MQKSKSTNYIAQGSILAVASILSRMIGLLYRIPVTNVIGDIGNDYYSAAYEVYNMILLISSYSLPLAVSKIVSSKAAVGEYKNISLILKTTMCMALVIGVIASGVTYFGAGYFTGTILKTPQSKLSLQILAIAIFVMALMGVLRGFFQGLGTMMPTAVSQIVEQIINAIVSVVAAYYLFSYGQKLDLASGVAKGEQGYIYGAAGSTLGTTFGAISGFLFLIFIMFSYNQILQKKMRRDKTEKREEIGSILFILIGTIFPVLLSTAVYNISGIIDQGIYKNLMYNMGYTAQEVSTQWGIYVGKYKVLTNVPIAIASALAASTIPALVQAHAKRDRKEMRRKTATSIRMVMLVLIPSAFGLMALAEPITSLIWGQTNTLTVQIFQLGSIAVIFYGLSTLTNGILQGIGKMQIPVRNAVIALVLHVGVLVFLVQVLDWTIFGVIISYILFAIFMCILNGLAIRKYLKYRQEFKKTFLIPLLCAAVMGLSIWLLEPFASKYIPFHIGTVLLIFLAVCIYGFFLVFLQGITEEELKLFPKGTLVIRILKKTHLL